MGMNGCSRYIRNVEDQVEREMPLVQTEVFPGGEGKVISRQIHQITAHGNGSVEIRDNELQVSHLGILKDGDVFCLDMNMEGEKMRKAPNLVWDMVNLRCIQYIQ